MPFLTDFCQIVKLYYVILFVIEFYFYIARYFPISFILVVFLPFKVQKYRQN